MVDLKALHQVADEAAEPRDPSQAAGVKVDGDPTEAEVAWTHVHELTKALTGLVGGGSEMFLHKHGRYIADIPYCVGRLRERSEVAHRHVVKETTRAKEAEAAKAELVEALEEIAQGNWMGEMRFAEDSDADFLLRVIAAYRRRARAAVAKAEGSSQ